jgi:hypothetical protein
VISRLVGFFAVLLCFTQAFALSQVEFFVGDRVDPTRKWGHVSLHVVQDDPNALGGEYDLIFDFGRYGRMWHKDAEGDPILRVWDHAVAQYIRYHMDEGGTTKRYTFTSTPERNAVILAWYQDAIARGSHYTRDDEGKWDAWLIGTRAFHAVDFNCTTTSISAFMIGFPEYNLNIRAYAKARTLGFFIREAAKSYGGYRDGTWGHIWWPLDLRAALEEVFAARGLATVQAYRD